MKLSRSIRPIYVAIISILLATNVNAGNKLNGVDTTCCAPDSLAVISTNYPTFCVRWQVSADSNCINPYGFEIRWAYFPGSGPWHSAIIPYAGGTIINFCSNVDTCRSYQWMVRTICDTANGGIYSDWVGGRKFVMTNCGGGPQDKLIDKYSPIQNSPKKADKKNTFSSQAIKSKENSRP